jgi:asparagine synthase (glutamine-hydrolysing)
MSGICAAWAKDNPQRVAGTLGAVMTRLSLAADARSAQETDLDAGVAARGRSDDQKTFRTERLLLACDADLLNAPELASAIGRSEPLGTAALLAALYERHGDRFVEHLRGAFAVVLWDAAERRMLAAIDRFGIKRLAWFDDGNILLLASRVDALHAGVDGLQVNPRAIVNVLNFSADLAPETIFSRVYRLGPGMMLRASAAGTQISSYWDMRYGLDDGRSEAELSRELEAVVERSVAAHCATERSDALGAFLSGGTDSSTVVGMMTRTRQAPVKAFSIGFQEERFNELEYADLAARTFGSEHRKYLVSAADCFESLPAIVRCFDEPFGNSSAIATYFCARLAAAHGVRTLLAGDGGDELFGGNERYATEKIFEVYHALPRWMRRSVVEPLVAASPRRGLTRKAHGYIRRANMPGVERMFSFQFLRAHALEDVFDGDFLRSLGDYGVLDIPARHYADAPARDHLDRLLYVDMKITLADNDLPKVTCVSELAGVRPRFPFLDRDVAEFSGRIPPRLKVKGFKKRYLFKRAFADLLPSEIIRKKKHGFGIPVASWLKSDPPMRELAHDTLLSARASGRGYFRREFLEELFRKNDETDAPYYGDILWTFLMVELWHKQFIDQRAPVAA